MARRRMRGGTRRPKDTAMTRLYETGGAQPVKVSKTCVWRDRSRAALLMGTRASQLVPLIFFIIIIFFYNTDCMFVSRCRS